jgi:hypothetical protein
MQVGMTSKHQLIAMPGLVRAGQTMFSFTLDIIALPSSATLVAISQTAPLIERNIGIELIDYSYPLFITVRINLNLPLGFIWLDL